MTCFMYDKSCKHNNKIQQVVSLVYCKCKLKSQTVYDNGYQNKKANSIEYIYTNMFYF